jgi:DNA-binding HxlR family transcriptional regulator
MKRKSFENMECPVARVLERVGEWWSILILRDAAHGLTRFDQFEASLKIAPNMLTRRLATLVESGLLEKRLYSERPPRSEYLLTERGRDFMPVLYALAAFGNRQFAPDGRAVEIIDTVTGKPAEPVVVDAATGVRLSAERFGLAAGPAASPGLRRRYEAKAAAAKSVQSAQSSISSPS